jgi:phosphoglycolate phosphatase
MYKALIFDLDGTLLDTLPDIRLAINTALKQCGYSYEFSLKDAHNLIGDGADMLVKRALKEKGDDPKAFQQLKEAYMPLYQEYQDLHTKPFNGLPETLRFLSERGIKLFVASNKPDALAKTIVEAHYGKDTFVSICGNMGGEPVKPNPILIIRILEISGLRPQDCLCVGDSIIDVQTAKNAGMDSCLVTWGYGFYKPELLKMPKYVVNKPKQLAQAALGNDGW